MSNDKKSPLCRSPVSSLNVLAAAISIGNWHVLGIGAVVGVSFVSVWLKIYYLADVLFLFDFVISMTIGVMVGIMLRRTNNDTHRQFTSTIQDIGSVSLDASRYIVSNCGGTVGSPSPSQNFRQIFLDFNCG